MYCNGIADDARIRNDGIATDNIGRLRGSNPIPGFAPEGLNATHLIQERYNANDPNISESIDEHEITN